MARARVEHETERALAVDADRRPDAADPVAARGGDESRLVGRDGDVVEHDRRHCNGRLGRGFGQDDYER